jgi:hypothetical protein
MSRSLRRAVQKYSDADSRREGLFLSCLLYWLTFGAGVLVGFGAVLLGDASLTGWLPPTIFALALSLVPILVFLAVLAVSLAIISFPFVARLVGGREVRRVQRILCSAALFLGFASVISAVSGPVDGLVAIPLLGVGGLMLTGAVLRLALPASNRDIAGYCANCGYNLTGNTSGTCPECGRVVSEDADL